MQYELNLYFTVLKGEKMKYVYRNILQWHQDIRCDLYFRVQDVTEPGEGSLDYLYFWDQHVTEPGEGSLEYLYFWVRQVTEPGEGSLDYLYFWVQHVNDKGEGNLDYLYFQVQDVTKPGQGSLDYLYFWVQHVTNQRKAAWITCISGSNMSPTRGGQLELPVFPGPTCHQPEEGSLNYLYFRVQDVTKAGKGSLDYLYFRIQHIIKQRKAAWITCIS